MGFTLVPAGAPSADAVTAGLPAGAFTVVPPSADDPTAGMSPLQLGMAGFGRVFPQAWLGLKERALQAAGLLPGVDTSKSVAALENETAAAQRQDAPLMAQPWAQLGAFAGNMALGLPLMIGGPQTFLGRLLASSGAGAAQGALQPTTAQDSTLGNIARGAAIGVGAQGALETAALPLRAVAGAAPASADVGAAQAFAAKYGGTLTRGQIGGNAYTQRIEKMLASLPGSAPYYANAGAANLGAATRAINDITGGDAGRLIQIAPQGAPFVADQAAFDAANALPRQFEQLPVGEQPTAALRSTRELFGPQDTAPNPELANVPAPLAKALVAQGKVAPTVPVGKAPTLAPGTEIPMTGPYGDFNNYQALRSLYGGLANRAVGNQDAAAYYGLQGILDDTAARSLAAAGVDPAAIASARNAYAVQKIVQPARVVDNAGNVSYDPSKIASVVQQVDRQSPGKLDALGDAGQALRQIAAFGRTARMPNSSGTAEGIAANRVATGAILADILRDPGGALGNALSMFGTLYGAPRIINAAMQGTRNGIPFARTLAGAMVGPTASYLGRTIPLSLLASQPILPP